MMEELLATLNHKPWTIVRGLAFIDTCFFIDEMCHHRDKELLGKGLGLLSFNAEELVHVSHHLPDDIKQHIRHFLKLHTELLVVDAPVSPGDAQSEKDFVNHVDPHLLELIPDPSDAVLLAVAIRTRSAVLTKDKHHLFTAVLNNYAKDHGVKVFKEMKDYLSWAGAMHS